MAGLQQWQLEGRKYALIFIYTHLKLNERKNTNRNIWLLQTMTNKTHPSKTSYIKYAHPSPDHH